MSSSTATLHTMMKMLETLPEPLQERVFNHLCEYIEDIRDEAQWNSSFAQTQTSLAAAAQQVRKEIRNGKARPLRMNDL